MISEKKTKKLGERTRMEGSSSAWGGEPGEVK
jgi:hypothetical protein